MKVIILGPVINKFSSGGVATITESLALGFKKRNDDVQIISISKSDSIPTIVIGNGRNKRFKIFFSYRKIAKALKKEKPDLVVSSLEYSLGIKRYKKNCPSSTYVSFLHGVAVPIKGRKVKSRFINMAARYCCKHFDHTSIASYLTQSINSKIYNIKCDVVIPNGIDTDNIPIPVLNKREYDFVYIGRLYRDKNVELLCDAFLELCEEMPNLKMLVCGYGELEHLFTNGKFATKNITFKGFIPHSEVFSCYSKGRFFISLCDLEGYGTVFMEAALQRCNLVSSFTQGQNYVFDKQDYYHLVDISSKESLRGDLKKCLESYSEMSDEQYETIKTFFSCKRMADDYAKLVK